ncbi:MAG: YebC/PmpR family DNA-binding transcriptional regulator [Phycisphaerales bacterium]|nr:YebC/PmpR family DNA-binding transcriptional regulator [Phycisphaerales bacterium]
MAGHSHWANIKHKKAKTDSRRGKVWGKCAKAIMVAAKNGGPDPASNLALRYAIDEARFENMPKDTIERAIKKGAGQLDGADFEPVRYEGYGPGGLAVVVDALTDNRTRTAPEVRGVFLKYGGNLGAIGCVSYNFEHKGLIRLPAAAATEDRLLELAIEAGADDVSLDGDIWTITTPPTALLAVKDAVERAGLAVESSELTLVPGSYITLSGDQLASAVKMIDALEDNDDVQKVYTNLDASDEELAKLG